MARRKSSRRKSSTPRGKAAAMGPELWQHWVRHVRRHSPWLAACITLTYALALRITESLGLKAGDFDFRNHTVRIAGLKGAATVKKPMLKSIRPLLTGLRKHGLSTIRVRHCGARGEVRKKETWVFPQENHRFLFPSRRSDAKLARRSKDSVCKSLSRLRKSFNPPKKLLGSVDLDSIRSHSGRQSWINACKMSQVPDHIGMEFARIRDLRRGDPRARAMQAHVLCT